MRALALLVALLSTPALAQNAAQVAEPSFMQNALNAVAEQRNQALNGQAATAAQLALTQEELRKLRERIKTLEEKYEPAPAAAAK